MQADLKTLKDRSTVPEIFDIEKGQVRRFARAVGEDNAIHFDEAAAQAAGFSSLVAPPTFYAALAPLQPMVEAFDLDPQALMHAEEEYEYFRPICAGDSVSIVHRVVDAYVKETPGGKLTFIVIETRGTDAQRRPVFKGRRVLVERKN